MTALIMALMVGITVYAIFSRLAWKQLAEEHEKTIERLEESEEFWQQLVERKSELVNSLLEQKRKLTQELLKEAGYTTAAEVIGEAIVEPEDLNLPEHDHREYGDC